MINPKTQERELCYVARITKITPIEGADNIELITINDGWVCIAKIGEFKVDDLCVYFEIDSKLPEAEWSEFLASKHYKVKTMKLGKFKVISQGLALPVSAFGWELGTSGQFAEDVPIIITKDKNFPYFAEGDFLTSYLGVTYSVAEDNKRKAPSVDKYKKMAQRHPKVFQKSFVRWLYKRNWGKKLLFVFFGKKKDTRNWPQWVVKTDEERVENMPWVLQDKNIKWFATEKIDGTSTTFTLKRAKNIFTNSEYYVCSRNVVFDTPEKAERCYYDSNVYLEMAEKYNMRQVLGKMLALDDSLSFVTIQGETYGESIQKRTYGLKGRDLAVFNVIFGYNTGEVVRLNPHKMKSIMDEYEIPTVPILNESYILPDTIEELRVYVDKETSKIDGKMKEGIVFRSSDGKKSFKCVSPTYLIKYHS